MKLNVFGRLVQVVREGDEWLAFYLGNEGKKRKAHDIILPAYLAESEIIEYIADLCHEWATPVNAQVVKLP